MLLGALVAGGAVVSAAAANAALITDDVSFTATLTYTDETTGISSTGLNISLGSALGFTYSPTGVSAGVLFVGGVEDTVQMVQYSPATNDFVLRIGDFTGTPGFLQVVYAQTAASDFQFFTAKGADGGSVTVTPVTGGVPEPSTWAMMLAGFAGLGFLGYRQTVKARLAA